MSFAENRLQSKKLCPKQVKLLSFIANVGRQSSLAATVHVAGQKIDCVVGRQGNEYVNLGYCSPIIIRQHLLSVDNTLNSTEQRNRNINRKLN